LARGGNCDDDWTSPWHLPTLEDEAGPFRAPPGLELEENEPAKVELAPMKKAGATRLSLADMMCGPMKKNMNKMVKPPPGLELFSADQGLEPPPGLSLSGTESDDTTRAGSNETDESEEECGLVVVERNELKANAPMFNPMLTPSTAALLMPDVAQAAQRTPLRTKLCSKASVYTPQAAQGPLPFVPMAAVEESWQKWYAKSSMYGGHADYYSEQDGATSYDANAEYYSEHDLISSYDGAANFYEEQEWPYEM